MAKGVKTGGGSRKGKPNKKTAELVQAVEQSGVTPLEYMLDVMRDPATDADRRDDMAKAAAPFVHAKLQPIDGKTGSAEVRAHVLVEFQGPPS